ncbi:MAG: ribulose-phosphate 3-epimerase [Synergistaceae bacterium]|jgi:ribulose-phosphate 3-epimerase|nr:ribulose-phosphate 3-epimerase [Synergistaceae bacterium]
MKKGKKFLLAPSILSADPLAIADSIERTGGEFDWIHVDVMDGHFVPNLSFGPPVVSALRARYPDAFIDVHIMVEPAEDFIDMFAVTRPDLITLHAEATNHVSMALSRVRSLGIHPGVSINPGTSVCLIEPVLSSISLVLVMAVNPGFGGQKFMPEVLLKVRDLVRFRAVHDLEFLIEVDGGVGMDNAADLVSSGCDVLVAGSAIFGDHNSAEAARRIRRQAGL